VQVEYEQLFAAKHAANDVTEHGFESGGKSDANREEREGNISTEKKICHDVQDSLKIAV
jgi:hypothetical protein